MSSDRKCTLDILSALIAMQATSSRLVLVWMTFHVDILRIAERLLGLQPGDGPQALRMIHSLVHITGESLVSDDANLNLRLPEYYSPSRYDDMIWFHHKSFVDYLLDPSGSRSLEYCVNMEEMNTRLSLECIVTMQTFSLQPRPSRIACSTFPLRFTYYILITLAECSYLGLCNTLLDPSRY